MSATAGCGTDRRTSWPAWPEASPSSPANVISETMPIFETAAPSLAWLNRMMAVAAGERHADKVIITVYEIL